MTFFVNYMLPSVRNFPRKRSKHEKEAATRMYTTSIQALRAERKSDNGNMVDTGQWMLTMMVLELKMLRKSLKYKSHRVSEIDDGMSI